MAVGRLREEYGRPGHATARPQVGRRSARHVVAESAETCGAAARRRRLVPDAGAGERCLCDRSSAVHDARTRGAAERSLLQTRCAVSALHTTGRWLLAREESCPEDSALLQYGVSV